MRRMAVTALNGVFGIVALAWPLGLVATIHSLHEAVGTEAELLPWIMRLAVWSFPLVFAGSFIASRRALQHRATRHRAVAYAMLPLFNVALALVGGLFYAFS
ncbi:hypothetical protein [Niveibacterium sp. SC-1]|uniref:hypothetical protein n=1 Tax=Niveibacterium sp. SC-1 TaxID=3135646 RepID=UPI00311ED9EF